MAINALAADPLEDSAHTSSDVRWLPSASPLLAPAGAILPVAGRPVSDPACHFDLLNGPGVSLQGSAVRPPGFPVGLRRLDDAPKGLPVATFLSEGAALKHLLQNPEAQTVTSALFSDIAGTLPDGVAILPGEFPEPANGCFHAACMRNEGYGLPTELKVLVFNNALQPSEYFAFVLSAACSLPLRWWSLRDLRLKRFNEGHPFQRSSINPFRLYQTHTYKRSLNAVIEPLRLSRVRLFLDRELWRFDTYYCNNGSRITRGIAIPTSTLFQGFSNYTLFSSVPW